ncbi:hypothetical protein KKG83_04950 [Candidatus Micrarchaeota archaeon]|nr:hypothetical protein [Candidatus Micrarchaeota archaeon]
MSSEEMIISKKQMLIAVLIILALIAVSAGWIIYSNQEKKDLNDSDNNIVPDSNNLIEEKPAFIKIIILEKLDCIECASLDSLVDAISSFDVNILEVKRIDSVSEEGQNLIKMHEITMLPSLIVNGEFNGTELQSKWSEIGEEKNGVLILRKPNPPYYSLEEDRLAGKVDVLLIQNSSCDKCVDLSTFPQDLEQVGVFIRDYNVLEFDSPEAKELLEYYLVDRLPVVFLSLDAAEYDFLSSVWDNLGTVESDGVLVYREAVPYFDVFSGEVKGLVEVLRLEDKNCADCLDSNLMVDPLKQMGIEIVKDSTIDVSSEEGKSLIEKYSITKIPTVIVSSEAEEYLDFFTVWPEVGSQEDDGNFVFRSLEIFEQKFITLE